jgi:hypothetical protein
VRPDTIRIVALHNKVHDNTKWFAMKSKSKSEYVKGFGRVTFAWGIVPTGVAVQNVPGQREWKAFKKLANGKAKR